jgi:hypothetical protein
VHHLGADDCLPIGPRTIKWIFLLADVTTVVTQLAGTALTITFGDLVKIGKWVSDILIRSILGDLRAGHNRCLIGELTGSSSLVVLLYS